MREFWTWLACAVLAAVLIALGVFGRAHAEPAGTLPACVTSARLAATVTDAGATAWPIEGLRAVRFLSIIKGVDPKTDYRADAVLAVFPPESERMAMFLVNSGCAGREKITLPARTAVMAMREVFGSKSREDGLTLVHDQWRNGDPVPPWVKKACCGPEDIHYLEPEQVQQTKDGWIVDGYKKLVPNGTELPSPDGKYWIFYRTFSDGTQSSVYCFFVPIPSM